MRLKTGGAKSQEIGATFESMVEIHCLQHRIACLKIPEACRKAKNKMGHWVIKPIKSPFDFIAAKDGQTVCFDAKTIDSKTFPRSQINFDQVEKLELIGQGTEAGYVIWFRPSDRVVFFDWRRLSSIVRGDSLKDDEGLYLGDGNSFNVGRVWK